MSIQVYSRSASQIVLQFFRSIRCGHKTRTAEAIFWSERNVRSFYVKAHRTVPKYPVPLSLMECARLTSIYTNGTGISPVTDETKLGIIVDADGYIRANPYYTPAFVLKNGILSLPKQKQPCLAFCMEDRVCEIAEEFLVLWQMKHVD